MILSHTERRLQKSFYVILFLIASCLSSFAQITNREAIVHIIFVTPADVSTPAGVPQRLTQVANAAEQFFVKWMNYWGYSAADPNLFQRDNNGSVEVLKVHGDRPLSSGKYSNSDSVQEFIQQALHQYHLPDKQYIWWIFVYLGDRPARFQQFLGTGNPKDGGWAIVNYDTLAGEIQPSQGLAEGFNGRYFLKGTIHELGHAFGLPHLGPDATLALGNSLMGPTTAAYAARKYPKPEQVYLSASAAAMLWKHPAFSGASTNEIHLPAVKLADYKTIFDKNSNCIDISGRLISDQTAHSVVLLDDQGRPKDEYWVQSFVGRIGTGGVFQIKIKNPTRVSGHYRILFCFDNGLVTGDGKNISFGNLGEIVKTYSYREDEFRFGDH